GGAADEALADLDDMFADSGPPPPSAEKPSLLASTLACTAAPAVGDTELSCTADSGTWAEATEATQPELEKRGALAEFRPPERGLGEEAACGEAGGPQASLLGGAPAKAVPSTQQLLDAFVPWKEEARDLAVGSRRRRRNPDWLHVKSDPSRERP
ncbi:unnamed protein product, partial [Prorocentrum cordatum]